jgi:hypothetical protein
MVCDHLVVQYSFSDFFFFFFLGGVRGVSVCNLCLHM